jgi:hypothetical protein
MDAEKENQGKTGLILVLLFFKKCSAQKYLYGSIY